MRHEQAATYNKRPVIVAMGFDIPLQGYFMTVEPVDEDNPDADPETGMIYSNLDDPELKETRGLSKNLEIFRQRLEEMSIYVPELFFAKVLAD